MAETGSLCDANPDRLLQMLLDDDQLLSYLSRTPSLTPSIESLKLGAPEKSTGTTLKDAAVFTIITPNPPEQDNEALTNGSSKAAAQPNQPHRNWLLACVLLLICIVLGTSATQLSNFVFVDPSVSFRAPYLFTFLKMAFRLTLFPIYLLVTAVVNLVNGRPAGIRATIRHCEEVFGEGGLTVRSYVCKIMPAAVFMIGQQLLFTYALANLTSSIATAILSMGVATSYIMSWLFLKTRILLVKSIFVVISVIGVALISYAGFVIGFGAESDVVFGTASAVGSVFALNLHQLAFKKAFPKADLGQTSFVHLFMFSCICLIFWPVPVITKVTGEEQYDIWRMPYDMLIPTWFMAAVSSLFYGYGLILSSPYFMSMGDVASLAANAVLLTVIDALIRGFTIPTTQIAGSVLIAVAFVVMILPDHMVSIRLRRRPTKQSTK